jgi:molybdopterin molybdotransferase
VSEPISVEAARAAVLAEVAAPLPGERVPLDEALGRVLSRDAEAPEDVPAFDNSAMDGYALRAADTEGAGPGSPVRLRVIDESRAGSPAAKAVEPGTAIAISTGAALPEGADAVLRVEDVRCDGEWIEFETPLEPGHDVRRAGDDVRAGTRVLTAGTLLGPPELGVLASLGEPRPECARRPRVAVLCTGDELLAPDEPMRPGGVRNSNGLTLPALARRAGAEVSLNERVPDDPDATRAALERALQSDVVVCCGGVSVGPHDHVKGAVAELGVAERFWRVALRPGRPTWFGVHEDGGRRALVFGLPGNPVSAFVTFVLFVRPALRALTGTREAPERATAALATEVPRLAARDQAVRCRLELTDAGWVAHPTGPQGSHVLTSLLEADALAIVAAGEEPAAAGERVTVELLRA